MMQLRHMRKIRMGLSEEAGYFCYVRACWFIYFWGGWIFLGRLGLSVRVGIFDIGLDWDGLFWKYSSLREICFEGTGWDYWKLIGVPFIGDGGWDKYRSSSGMVDFDWRHWLLRRGEWNIDHGIGSLCFDQINWLFMRLLVEWNKLSCYVLYGIDVPYRLLVKCAVWN